MHGFDLGVPPPIFLETEEQARAWVPYFVRAAEVCDGLGLDTETTGLGRLTDRVVVWSLSDGYHRVCIPAELLPVFKEPVLENPNIYFDMTNPKFDAHMLLNSGVDISKAAGWRDTIVQSWLYNENNTGRHGLKECVQDHFHRVTPTFEAVFGKVPPTRRDKRDPARVISKTSGDLIMEKMADRPTGLMAAVDYASLDAFNSKMLRHLFDHRLAEMPAGEDFGDLYRYFHDIEVPFSKVLWKCERAGVQIDTAYLGGLEGPVKKTLENIEELFSEHARQPISLTKLWQAGWFFYELLQKPVTAWTSGGESGKKAPQLNADVLAGWIGEGDPWALKMLEFRKLQKLYGTYIEGIKKRLGPDGRIHTTYNQTGAGTGRLSCVDGGTLLDTSSGKIRISELDLTKTPNVSIMTHKLRQKPILAIIEKGEEEMFEVTLTTGQSIVCTMEHRLLTPSGWRRLSDLKEEDEVLYCAEGSGDHKTG